MNASPYNGALIDANPYSAVLWALALALGGLACVDYFTVMALVSRAGFRIKLFATPLDTVRMFQEYRSIAPRYGWPTWPTTLFWVLAAGMFSLAILSWIPFSPR